VERWEEEKTLFWSIPFFSSSSLLLLYTHTLTFFLSPHTLFILEGARETAMLKQRLLQQCVCVMIMMIHDTDGGRYM